MNLFSEIHEFVLATIGQLQEEGALPKSIDVSNVTVEPPRDAKHGDMATNAAMVLAKPAGKNPRELAKKLSEKLMDHPMIAAVDVAGPGFLNLHLEADFWQQIVTVALAAGPDFGRANLGRGAKVNLEFVSTNPTGPVHVGHTRGAVFGDALASLLDFAGYEVTREYYINDGGAQVDVLARSAYQRYREAHGEEPVFEEGTYPGEYLKKVGSDLKDIHGDAFIDQPEDVWLEPVRLFATDAMMEMIREDLGLLGVEMDVYFSEKSLYNTGKIEAALQRLSDQGLIYEGVLEPPKGKKPDDWEPREQTLFRSTDHGDDVDRPVKKSDGSWTYFAPDIAYHFDKIERGFDQLIDVFGADHGGYIKRMKAAVSALSEGCVPLDIKIMQLVNLFKDGQPYKMSKRAGTFITLRDLVEQVGPGVVRFVMLMRKNDAPLDFDFDKVLEQSKDNPVFYVQYAHARCHSVLTKAAALGIDCELANADGLDDPAELALMKKLAEWPRLLELAAKHNEPHRVAFYLYDLASEFHSLWNAGNDKVHLRFLQEDDLGASAQKITLLRAVQSTIKTGLGLLGVTPIDEMR